MITKDQLIEMFERIAAKTTWDLSKPMLWAYFFTDESRETLTRVAPLLEASGYRVVEIYLSKKDDPTEHDLWWLHVEKIEVHTPDTLHERNLFLEHFAHDNGVDSYDGMDVGPASANE